MSWSRIVWVEGKKEFEDVVPSKWITEGENGEMVLQWPPFGEKSKELLGDQAEPANDWRRYKIVKIKIKNGEDFFSIKTFGSNSGGSLFFFFFFCCFVITMKI